MSDDLKPFHIKASTKNDPAEYSAGHLVMTDYASRRGDVEFSCEITEGRAYMLWAAKIEGGVLSIEAFADTEEEAVAKTRAFLLVYPQGSVSLFKLLGFAHRPKVERAIESDDAMSGIGPGMRGDPPMPTITTDSWGVGRSSGDEVRDYWVHGAIPITDHIVEQIAVMPRTWEPDNPYYVKSHVNAPGTVRSWFRKMRAADFARDLPRFLLVSASDDPRDISQDHYGTFRRRGWTLFDTQQVVDRETQRTYPKLEVTSLLFLNSKGQVLGVITDVAMPWFTRG